MINYVPTPDFYNDYISHHGIKGQKWGVQNGPPYPLGSSVSTGHKLKNVGSVKKKKPRIATSVSRMMKDIEKGDREFTTDQLNMLAKARLRDEASRSPGFMQWLNETDPELKKYDPTKHEETVERFRKETTPEFRGKNLKTKEDLDNSEKEYLELYKRQEDLTNKLEGMGIERHYTKEGRTYSKELKRVNEALNSDEYRNISDLRTSRDLIQRLIKSGKTADYWSEDSERSNMDYYQIQSTIKNVIGNWYESEPHTKSFAEGLEKIEKAYNAMRNEVQKDYHDYSKSAMARREAVRKKYRNAQEDLIGAVLKDMGLPDTPSNREFLYYVVIDD